MPLASGISEQDSGGPKLYEEDINVPSAGWGKLLNGISFTNTITTSGETVGVFAVSGLSPAQSSTNSLTVASNSTLNITGAPVVSFGNLTLSSGKLSLTTTDARVLLEFSGVTPGSGAIDLASNDMVIHNGNLATITSLLKSGFNNGAWNGSGIISSAAGTKGTGLAVVLNSNGSTALVNTFDGQTALTTDVLIKFTWLGDTNLDGVVNSTDLSNLNSRIGWNDFNYDGKVNADDYSLFMLGATESGGANISATLPEPEFLFPGAAGLVFLRPKRRA